MPTPSQPVGVDETDPAAGDVLRSRRDATVIAVLCVAAFMASLDLFVVNVAFADIGRSLHTSSVSDLSWVLNAYAVAYAAFLVPFGRLADRHGRKPAFLLGLALFTLASLACAASPGVWWLVAARTAQAIGAAALTPASLGLLLTAVAPHRRVPAVRIWAASGAVAAAFGPVVGGVLVQISWHWAFLVNLPIGVLALVAALAWVPDSRDESAAPPDLLGAALLAVAVGAAALGLVRGPSWGWTSGGSFSAFGVAVLAAAAFGVQSGRHPAPVIERSLLRIPSLVWTNTAMFWFSAAFAAQLLATILWMQQVWQYSVLRSGLAVAPGPLMVPIFAAVAQVLARRVSPGVIAAIGSALFGLGGLWVLLAVGPEPAYATRLLPGWIVGGIGVGFALPTLLASGTSGLPPQRVTTGSAVVSMTRQIGTVLGVSILVATLGTPVGYAAVHASFVHGWTAGVVLAALGAVTALPIVGSRGGVVDGDRVAVGRDATAEHRGRGRTSRT